MFGTAQTHLCAHGEWVPRPSTLPLVLTASMVYFGTQDLTWHQTWLLALLEVTVPQGSLPTLPAPHTRKGTQDARDTGDV